MEIDPGEAAPNPDSDPIDLIVIGLPLLGVALGGGSFLEARRQRQLTEQQERRSFRRAWQGAQRDLRRFADHIDEFEPYVQRNGYGEKTFRFGSVAVSVDRGRAEALKRLHRETLATARSLAEHVDDLSNYLGPEDEEYVEHVHARLGDLPIPERYSDVLLSARRAWDAYSEFLGYLEQKEQFQVGRGPAGLERVRDSLDRWWRRRGGRP